MFTKWRATLYCKFASIFLMLLSFESPVALIYTLTRNRLVALSFSQLNLKRVKITRNIKILLTYTQLFLQTCVHELWFKMHLLIGLPYNKVHTAINLTLTFTFYGLSQFNLFKKTIIIIVQMRIRWILNWADFHPHTIKFGHRNQDNISVHRTGFQTLNEVNCNNVWHMFLPRPFTLDVSLPTQE